jgi:hypothetical protein
VTEDMLAGTFDFLTEDVDARTFSVEEVVAETFILSVAETIFLLVAAEILVEVSGTSAFFFFLFTLLLALLRVRFLVPSICLNFERLRKKYEAKVSIKK